MSGKVVLDKGPSFGIRHLQCVLIFFGVAIMFGLRVNLSVAIVAMTDESNPNKELIYPWTESIKSYILSSFFWGYFFIQIPAGQLAHRYGGKVLLLLGIFISSLVSIVTPFCVKIGGWKMLCALRFLMGITQGAVHPSSHTLLSKWIPLKERGTLATMSYSGCPFGTIVIIACSGYLASTSIGWPSIFYVSGFAGVGYSFIWFAWGASSPRDYKGITSAERDYIESSLGGPNPNNLEHKKILKTPWSKIFSSIPFWVLALQHCVYNWGFWTMLTQIPTYIKHVLGMDIKDSALLSALPYVTMLILCYIFCGISKLLDRYLNLSIVGSRKLFNSISQLIPMVSIILLGYVQQTQTTLATILLMITIGCNSASLLGFHINHIDLSPNFAGILMSITNFIANIMSVGAPLVVGWVVYDEKNPALWRIIFFITGGLYLFGNLLFILFGKADVQSWNEPPVVRDEMEKVYINVKQFEEDDNEHVKL